MELRHACRAMILVSLAATTFSCASALHETPSLPDTSPSGQDRGPGRMVPWQQRVTVRIPQDWGVLQTKADDAAVATIYLVKKEVVGEESHPSNALLRYFPVPDTLKAADVAPGASGDNPLVARAQDSPNWTTNLLLSKERNVKYAILSRIGVFAGVGVEFVMSFPLTGDEREPFSILTLNPHYLVNKDMPGIYCHPAAVEEMVRAFNSVAETLRILGDGRYYADVQFLEPPKENFEVYRHEGE